MIEYKEPWKNYFTNYGWILYSSIIILGLIFRWYGLDVRPLHHDESLNAIYGRYFYENPTLDFYRYDPLLHGPLLYHLQPFVYQVLGYSKFAIRFLPAMIGSFFLFFPFLFRRFFAPSSTILMTVLIAFSPSLIYWSRFLRHDFLIILSLFLCPIAILLMKDTLKRNVIFFIGLTLAFCTKENSYVTVAILLGFLIFDFFFSHFKLKEKDSYLKRITIYIRSSLPTLPFCLALSAFIYCYFYSSGFQYYEGILDGLYRKSLSYWFQQHSIERISGPFIFHILSLSWYDFLFVLMTFIHIIHFYKRCSWKYRLVLFFFISFAFFSHLNALSQPIDNSIIARWFKLKISIDFYPALFLIIHSFHVCIYHLNRKRRDLAFWGYLFFSTFFTYSFVGEKVPWLSMYPLITGIIYLVYYFQETEILRRLPLKKVPIIKVPLDIALLTILIVFNIRMAIITNFSRAGADTEFISQVHTTKTYEDIALNIKKELEAPIRGYYPKVLSISENLWPLSWYLKGYPQYQFVYRGQGLDNYDFIFNRLHDPDTEQKLAKTHRKIVIPLRHWWVPDYKKMNWKNFLIYCFSHNPWNMTGATNVTYYVLKNRITLPTIRNGP